MRMIKLTNILVDQIIYGEPSEKHYKKMDMNVGPFERFDIAQWMMTPPPKNSSMTTRDELDWIQSIQRNEALIKSADHIQNHFKAFLESKNKPYPDELVKSLVKHSRPIILKLKYHYNRPRPSQLAEQFKKPLDNYYLDSMSTPSYPSGHSTQGILVAKVLGDMYPDCKEELFKVGKEISYSRLMSKAHFPSDSKFGEIIGSFLYESYKND